MKKTFFAFITLAVICSMLLSACGFNGVNKDGDKSESTSETTENVQNTTSAVNSTTSEYVIAKNTTAENQINATGISLSEKELTLYPGQNFTLTAKITPASATDNKNITWKSSNQNIATVSNGRINAIKNGITQITASLPDGRVASCVVTVEEKSLKQIYDSVSVDIGVCSSAIKNATASISTKDATLNKAAYQILISTSSSLKRIQENCYGYETFEKSTLKLKLDEFFDYMAKAKESLKAASDINSDKISSDSLEAKQYLQKASSKLSEVEKGLKNSQ